MRTHPKSIVTAREHLVEGTFYAVPEGESYRDAARKSSIYLTRERRHSENTSHTI